MKHLPSEAHKLNKKELIELFHIQMSENQELLKRIAELERDSKDITLMPDLLGDGFSGDSGFESVDEEAKGLSDE